MRAAASRQRAWRSEWDRGGATDVLILGALVVFAAIAAAAHRTVPGWRGTVLANLAVALGYLAVTSLARRLGPAARAGLRATAVFAVLAYLFGAVAPLQLVWRGQWLDGQVLAFEDAIFGVQPTIWLQRLTRPWLTESMMFAYVAYVALYPLVGALIWMRRGERALEHCLLALALANVVCDLGFVVLPVAGPASYLGDTFTTPLAGWVFTSLGELIRAKLHFPGGSLPSPHCAAATVLWAMAWRYQRAVAVALAPLIITLYASTVYCRYHYVSDAVSGIAVAIVVLALVGRWYPPGTDGATAARHGRGLLGAVLGARSSVQ